MQRFKKKKEKERFLRKKEAREKRIETGKGKRPAKPKERPIYVGEEETIRRHFAHLTRLLQEEEREDKQRFKTDYLDKRPEERERTGKSLYRLGLYGMHYNPSGQRLLTFGFVSGKFLPRYSITVGDVVRLSAYGGKEADCPVGTVYEKEPKQIIVAFRDQLPGWVGREGQFQLDLCENRTTYERMFDALGEVSSASHNRTAYLRDLSLGLRGSRFGDPAASEQFKWMNPNLNERQQEAVCRAFEAEDVFLIHGPPGTGKTCVLVEIIGQARKRDQTVLVSAPSNAACDHIVDCLVEKKVPVTRLGHPARMTPSIRDHTLSYKIARHPYAKLIEEHEARLAQMNRQADRRKDRRVMSFDEKREMRDEFRDLRAEIKQLRAEIFRQVWNESDVVVATHTVSGDPALKGRTFDWVIIDEATQGVEPSTWIPVLRAGKLIMAGDHCQLPPTVFSNRTGKGSLRYTLFERFYNVLDKACQIRLDVQYRMHEHIMRFSSKEFYENELVAHPSVKAHTLADLPRIQKSEATDSPIIFLDTAGLGYEEKVEPGSDSRYNSEEAGLVLKEYEKLLVLGVSPREIAIISPYSAQVKLLADRIFGEEKGLPGQGGLEIDSVDAFQGREKEAILVSLVRSNLTGKIGFLADTRRMNVALTRAKRKLIVVGDSATIANLEFYAGFIQYIESIKGYRSAWEYVE
ncbi:MAG: AAA family ATPase [Candidatus Omnitrophica bacterium]|nr:AAA family ATPase [Candidatus Omnitrophota bacterium]